MHFSFSAVNEMPTKMKLHFRPKTKNTENDQITHFRRRERKRILVDLHDKTKTPDQNDVKLGTVVVLDRLSNPIDFGFKRSKVGVIYSESVPICFYRECTYQ